MAGVLGCPAFTLVVVAWMVVLVGATLVPVLANVLASALVVVAGALVVVVVTDALVVLVVTDALGVVLVGATVVVVLAGAWVVAVVGAPVVAVGTLVVAAPWCQDRWLGGVAPEVLLTAKELTSAASATAMTSPLARARRRRIGGTLKK